MQAEKKARQREKERERKKAAAEKKAKAAEGARAAAEAEVTAAAAEAAAVTARYSLLVRHAELAVCAFMTLTAVIFHSTVAHLLLHSPVLSRRHGCGTAACSVPCVISTLPSC